MSTNNSSNIEDVITAIIETQNPWHDSKNRDWYTKDGSLRELMDAKAEGLYKPPKICYFLAREFFNPLFLDSRNFGVIVIRGPRRIGKTSTLKYLIHHYIDKRGCNPKNFIYLTLDSDELFREFERRRYLRELLDKLIRNFKEENKPLVIIIDEVTFYMGWARAIKNLIDSGSIGPGIALIATGSHSLDLSSAKRELSGRFGNLGEKLGGEQFFYPRRFIELAESILGDSFQQSIQRMYGVRSGRRMGLLEYFSGFQTTKDSATYNYDTILEEIQQKYYNDLHNLFENVYLYSGGYPRCIHEAIKSQRRGALDIPFARYKDDIYDLLVTDSTKFGLSEDKIKQMLLQINLPSMRLSQGFNTLGSGLKKDEISKYVEYLKNSGLLCFLPNISNPGQIDIHSLSVTPRSDNLKLIVTDPAAFISIFLCSRGTNRFSQVKELFTHDMILEFLFESIVISHLRYMPPLMHKTENLGYVITEDGEELSDAFAWYLDRSNRLILLAVEVKHTQKSIKIKDIERKASLLKENFNVKRLIVITNQKTLEIEEDYAIIPAEIFLLLL